jgi:hypothetical protein
MVSKAADVAEALPENVLQFSRQHGILEHVEKAMNAARDVFSDARRVSASVKCDPEYGYSYVDVHVLLHPDEVPEAEAEKYSECVGRWAPAVPPEEGETIHLSTSWK